MERVGGARRLLVVVSVMVAVMLADVPAVASSPGVSVLAGARDGRVPVEGATFNDPSTYGAPQRRIIDYVDDMISQTPPGETIRITQYNLTCGSTVQRLMAAFRRGVNVQIVVNDRVLSEDVANRSLYVKLRRTLGKNPSKPSFFVVCKRGCRTGKGAALHTKFISITKVRTPDGPRTNLMFTASGNITCGWATGRQYNDQYAIVGRERLFNQFNGIFAELAADRKVAKPFRRYQSGPFTAWFFPRPNSTRAKDPIWKALRAVQCRGALNTGPRGRTVVRVEMFTWNGNRGMNLARKLYELDQAGCDVEVILGAPGASVVREVLRPGRNGGIEVWDSRRDRDLDGEIDLYTHMKVLTIKGHWRGKPRSRVVFTGSANWTPHAFEVGDEILLQVKGRRAYRQYNQQFTYLKTRSIRRANTSTTVAKIKPYNLNPVVE